MVGEFMKFKCLTYIFLIACDYTFNPKTQFIPKNVKLDETIQTLNLKLTRNHFNIHPPQFSKNVLGGGLFLEHL